MTIEDAIEYNKNLKEYMRITDKKSEYRFLQENYEALDMANRALEVVQGMEEVFLQALPEFDMRDATEEERSSVKRYIDSISKSTGVKFDFNEVKTELEPYTDCVSRETAIKALKGIQPIDTEYDYTLYDEVDVLYILNHLPSVKPQQKWIPVSERLPEEEQYVLVTTNFNSITTCIYFLDSEYWQMYVIAWMPLPEPYEEDKE